MNEAKIRTAGSLILIGAAQFVICMIVAETLYHGYSTAGNYISDLGVGPSALIFNSSIFILGLLAAVAAYFLFRVYGRNPLPILILLAGIGAMGVGAFTEHTGMLHTAVSLVAFLFGGFSAIAAYKIASSPLNYLSVIMGLFALVALVLFGTNNYLGLGNGGMERMIAYPILLWAVTFGGNLIAREEK